MLDREHERRSAIRQFVEQPGRYHLCCAGCARIDGTPEFGADLSALGAGDAQPDQRADRGAQLGPLVIIEIGHAQRRNVVAVAQHEHGINDPDLSDITETSQLFRDPTLEQVAVWKADHERLNRSDAHEHVPPARHTPPNHGPLPPWAIWPPPASHRSHEATERAKRPIREPQR